MLFKREIIEYCRDEAKSVYDEMTSHTADADVRFLSFMALFELAILDKLKTEKNKIAFVQDTLHEIEQYVVSEIRKEGEK